MKKRLMTAALAATLAMTTAMSALAAGWEGGDGNWKYQNPDGTYATAGWHWLDGNGDGIAESYYFNESGVALQNTTTPDDYTVDGTGAWVENGVVQTKQVQGGDAAAATDRYTVIGGPPRIVPANGQLKGGFMFDRNLYNQFANNLVRTRKAYYIDYGEEASISYRIYAYNGEELTLGASSVVYGTEIGSEGKWVIDNSKPSVDAGKTNIRYQFNDGTFAGLGFHTPHWKSYSDEYGFEERLLLGEINPDGTKKDWRTDPTYMKADPTYAKYSGKPIFFFSEDGYLYTNILLDNVFSERPMMLGYDGTWLDRAEF